MFKEFTKAASLLEGRFHSTEPALQELLTAFYPRLVDEIIPSDIMPTLFEKKFLSCVSHCCLTKIMLLFFTTHTLLY